MEIVKSSRRIRAEIQRNRSDVSILNATIYDADTDEYLGSVYRMSKKADSEVVVTHGINGELIELTHKKATGWQVWKLSKDLELDFDFESIRNKVFATCYDGIQYLELRSRQEDESVFKYDEGSIKQRAMLMSRKVSELLDDLGTLVEVNRDVFNFDNDKNLKGFMDKAEDDSYDYNTLSKLFSELAL